MNATTAAAGHDPVHPMDETELADLQRRLLAWYRAHRRDLPWRRTRNPYHILVAEVMLQQTQVDRVIPKYHAFLARFPTIAALAAAPTAEVIRAWAGLGYNRRAVNLQRTAQAVVERHGGELPRDLNALLALPGIGRYTAGAIACFAYEQDVGIVDTNIRRVLHRLFIGPELPVPQATPRAIQALADRLVPPGEGYDWNQGLMEFGAVHCTARKPACVVCPLRSHCRAYPAIQAALAAAPGAAARREEPFVGSSRYYRGRVIAALRRLPAGAAVDLLTLGPQVRDDFSPAWLPWLYEVVAGLARDGLAQLAEERAAYDAGDPAAGDPGRLRVRLPH
ncbi:MAG: A/G-specific adenine glycosylase [Sphaerobacter sp.]|nr:A/G-specific adenine glycosylase [Sphaerobacter sp.]